MTDESDDEFSYWRFSDLRERRIVSDRADLFRKQQRGFPRAIKLTPGRGGVALFLRRAVKEWVRANATTASESDAD